MTIKNENPKNIDTALDCAVRDFNKMSGGYLINDIVYCNYMTNQDWNVFYQNIDESHKKQFEDGAGGELKEGNYPPKMASFGSSSRLIYELSHNIEGFSFEEKLDTRVGGIAHLDGCLKRGMTYVYIEAKMREIYGGSHETESIKAAYLDVYRWIRECCPKAFNFSSKKDNTKDGYSKVTFTINNKPVKFFDLKQLICHFLGITYDIAKHHITGIKVKFLYLLYNPMKIEITSPYKTKILDRYNDVKTFIEDNTGVFNLIFQAILSYQIEKHHLNKSDIQFEMQLVDQTNYNEALI